MPRNAVPVSKPITSASSVLGSSTQASDRGANPNSRVTRATCSFMVNMNILTMPPSMKLSSATPTEMTGNHSIICGRGYSSARARGGAGWPAFS